ncbi:hypothetical protein BV25DRAFT_1828319 [Artomyces pyxidatus]|uniref:Uncharacterized protein n=1 Tax=Artomyces pyxidatus TaxID=48021 RepID=A0ACB8SUL8_9AGAM|nr:hypothetical protein BV25DRAFT_1828319 [Artomyces pyxidatus]
MSAIKSRDGLPGGNSSEDAQPRGLTQQEHATISSAVDLHNRTQMVQIWSDRLQLVSVYASFFTSIDSLLLSLSASNWATNHTAAAKVSTASLSGALIFHAAAAILAYIGSFVLIRYKLFETQVPNPDSPTSAHASTHSAAESGHSESKKARPAIMYPLPSTNSGIRQGLGGRGFSKTLLSHTPDILSHPPDILAALLPDQPTRGISVHRVGFRAPKDPSADSESLMRLLTRCQRVCSLFALLGFVLVVVGIVTFVWTAFARGPSIFASACVAFAVSLGVVALV